MLAISLLKISPAPSYHYRFHHVVKKPSNWVVLVGDMYSIMHINPGVSWPRLLICSSMDVTADGRTFRSGIRGLCYLRCNLLK